jgi:hypothetical protein
MLSNPFVYILDRKKGAFKLKRNKYGIWFLPVLWSLSRKVPDFFAVVGAGL